ncbi:Tachykinin-like peptides receptor 86C [Portunus trituberculatus]|uniref:Tachykinin-like peptides receptor 86C n=1 Tax=Portunus trituberculatus TaxID=210409 RepID=A0A5B7DYR4_PORTR|nr:Tachykinin-like peptides receptor 86C [Portunus trituberculatus]
MEDNDKDKLGDKAVQAGGGSGSSGGGNGGGEGWPALLMECVLQAWPELNATHSLPVPSHTLSNTSHTFFFDHDFYRRLLNLSESGELNGTEAGGLSRERLEQCLAPPPADRPYLLPWWQQLTWTLAFGAMLLVAVGGNAIVMWIVIGRKSLGGSGSGWERLGSEGEGQGWVDQGGARWRWVWREDRGKSSLQPLSN